MFRWLKQSKADNKQVEQLKHENEVILALISKKQTDLFRAIEDALKRELKEQKS